MELRHGAGSSWHVPQVAPTGPEPWRGPWCQELWVKQGASRNTRTTSLRLEAGVLRVYTGLPGTPGRWRDLCRSRKEPATGPLQHMAPSLTHPRDSKACFLSSSVSVTLETSIGSTLNIFVENERVNERDEAFRTSGRKINSSINHSVRNCLPVAVLGAVKNTQK